MIIEEDFLFSCDGLMRVHAPILPPPIVVNDKKTFTVFMKSAEGGFGRSKAKPQPSC
jgi:hypothetical protein